MNRIRHIIFKSGPIYKCPEISLKNIRSPAIPGTCIYCSGVFYYTSYNIKCIYNEHAGSSRLSSPQSHGRVCKLNGAHEYGEGVLRVCAFGNGDRRNLKEEKKETEKTFPGPFVDNVLYYIRVHAYLTGRKRAVHIFIYKH